MTRPLCPRCGEPARQVRALAIVDFDLSPSGDFGHVAQVKRVDPATEREYVCGGGHSWKLPARVPA